MLYVSMTCVCMYIVHLYCLLFRRTGLQVERKRMCYVDIWKDRPFPKLLKRNFVSDWQNVEFAILKISSSIELEMFLGNLNISWLGRQRSVKFCHFILIGSDMWSKNVPKKLFKKTSTKKRGYKLGICRQIVQKLFFNRVC